MQQLSAGRALIGPTLVTCVAAMAVYALFHFVHKELAQEAATTVMPLAFGQGLALTQRKEISSSITLNPRGTVPFEGFILPWYLLLTYAALVLMAIIQVLGFIAGSLATMTGFEDSDWSKAVRALMLLATPFVTFLFGSWVGSRSGKLGIPVLIGAIVLSVVLGDAIDRLIISDQERVELIGQAGASMPYVALVFSAIVIRMPFALLGFWYGRRARFSKYLKYLLDKLPDDSKNTIVSLAYEETTRMAPQEQ